MLVSRLACRELFRDLALPNNNNLHKAGGC